MDVVDKIQFYYVAPDYIAYLKTVDARVPDVVYPGRHKKMLCGAVLQVNGISYYAPLSHNTSPSSTNFIIKNSKGKPVASLRLQYMVPVPQNVLSALDIPRLIKQDVKYGRLVLEEYQYCANNLDKLLRKANRVYLISQTPNHFLYGHHCNFAALEAAMLKYQNGKQP